MRITQRGDRVLAKYGQRERTAAMTLSYEAQLLANLEAAQDRAHGGRKYGVTFDRVANAPNVRRRTSRSDS